MRPNPSTLPSSGPTDALTFLSHSVPLITGRQVVFLTVGANYGWKNTDFKRDCYGAGLKDVQELLGHKDIKMTLRYAHLGQEHKKRPSICLTYWQHPQTVLSQIVTPRQKSK